MQSKTPKEAKEVSKAPVPERKSAKKSVTPPAAVAPVPVQTAKQPPPQKEQAADSSVLNDPSILNMGAVFQSLPPATANPTTTNHIDPVIANQIAGLGLGLTNQGQTRGCIEPAG